MSARSLARIMAMVIALAPGTARPEMTTVLGQLGQLGQLGHAPVASEAAQRELEAGLAAYDENDYATALEHFERAYALHPTPDYLYAWAQAARSSGDCATAIDLYRRFIDSGPSGDPRVAAQKNEARCAEQLAAAPPDLEVEPEPEPEEPASADPPAASEISDGARRPPDRMGLALLVPGVVGLAAGTALVAVAGARQASQANQTSYQGFHDLDAGIDRLYVAGAVTLGVGVVLIVAGALRLAKRPRHVFGVSRRTVLMPTFDTRGTAGILLRFAGPRDFGRGRPWGRSSDR
jgi:tetratricopeptide (TPR) repeat protein